MLRWGILGTGFISRQMITAIQATDTSMVQAIAGRNKQALLEFQETYNIGRSFEGYDAVFSDPDIDIIYIGLPNHVHHTMTMHASTKGKAVLCEKSLSTNMQNARDLVDSAAKNQTFCAEGLMYLSHPLIHRFVDLLKDGRLGALKSVSGTYAADIKDFVNPAGKGTLYNLGCYPVSLLHLVVQTLCGEAAFKERTLSGSGNTSGKDGNVCDAAAVARFSNGALATLQSTDTYGMSYEFSVRGERGVLKFVTNPWLPAPGRNHIRWEPYDGKAQDIFVDDDHDAFYHQVKMVERALDNDQIEAQRPSPRLQDSLEIMEFLTDWEASALKSQDTNQ